MTAEITSVTPKFLMPRNANKMGPQTEAERCLYELVMKGVNSGPSPRTSAALPIGELRARIHARR